MKRYGITGWKNTGKTGLVERLVAHFTRQGLTVSTIKHAHQSFDVDQPGTDSSRHRVAGAQEVLLASPKRVAILQELRDAPQPSLDLLLGRLSPCDLVLIEGFKVSTHNKIECHRSVVTQPPRAMDDQTIRALASDHPVEGMVHRPVFDLDDTAAIAEFIAAEVGL